MISLSYWSSMKNWRKNCQNEFCDSCNYMVSTNILGELKSESISIINTIPQEGKACNTWLTLASVVALS